MNRIQTAQPDNNIYSPDESGVPEQDATRKDSCILHNAKGLVYLTPHRQ